MAARDNDADSLISAIRTKCFLAQSGQSDNWTDDKILLVADDCTLEYIAPALKRAKVGWFRVDFNIALQAGVARYDVPEEAMWNGLEGAWLINPSTGQVSADINVVDPSNRMVYGGTVVAGMPNHIWFENSQIVFSPPPDTTAVSAYSCTVGMYRRPGQLVKNAQTVRVVSVNSVTQAMSVSATVPSSWTTDTFTAGSPYRIDCYARNLPNTRRLWNKTASFSSQTVTFSPLLTAAEFASISVGDVLTMKGTSNYPDIPPEGVPHLRKMIERTILTSQTDTEALQVYLGQQSESLANFMRGMSNRADGSPRKLSLSNAGGTRFIRNYGARFRRS